MEWYNILMSILSGLLVTVPLVLKLIEYVQKAVEEKNWNQLIQLVMNLMAEAEVKFDNGADRKSWVIAMVMASANTINYPIDEKVVGKLIDDLCAMSKLVNAPKTEE